MSLKLYKKKRHFKLTPEPQSKKKSSATGHIYVIQKHAASHLHYDLRLELNGVLKSWAVPKGPSLDPTIKRLAVHVEDHPINYAYFSGIIPKGQYGAGTVELWDRGTWQSEKNPAQAYKKGHLKFVIKGKKLKGSWHLVRIKNDPKNWLLIKDNDKYAEFSKNIQGIKTTMPTKITPQLTHLTKTPPQGNHWLHEIKFDGYRIICFVHNKKIKFITRHQQDWTDKFTVLLTAIKNLNLQSAIFDGEMVALGDNQRQDFQLLQNTLHTKTPVTLAYYIFDLIYLNGYDLSQVPLIERKKQLHDLLAHHKKSALRYSDHVLGSGKKIFKNACKLGLEGIVSKDINSPYIQKRTHQWLKTKCLHSQEFVIGGYTPPKGSRKHFGALLLGYYDKNHQLQYCGRVGTGFNEDSLKLIKKLLIKHKQQNSPFAIKPPDSKHVMWVEPKMIAEVNFFCWTDDKVLRHPSFKGLREDKTAAEVKLEKPKRISNQKVQLTHPDRILYPEHKITKFDLANYYEKIADWILPFVVNRPLVLVRCPDGYQNECFFQKHLDMPYKKPLYPIAIKEKNETDNYVYIKNINGILELVQLNSLEIHSWGCHVDNIEKPDMIAFDLDPDSDIAWSRVLKAAFLIKEILEKINLQSFVKTSGGKGLHIFVPIKRLYSWEEIKEFSSLVVQYMVNQYPTDYTGNMSKTKRHGKIFLDYFRNSRGATSVVPYSTRAKESAPISTPLFWEELNTKIKATSFDLNNISKRLTKLKKDPWQDFYKLKQTLPKLKKLS